MYREALKNVPNICEVLCVQDKAVDSMERLWTRDHIGRRVEREPSRITGCTNLYIYYGSSDFDTRQMAMLIDGLIQDALPLPFEQRAAMQHYGWNEDEFRAHFGKNYI